LAVGCSACTACANKLNYRFIEEEPSELLTNLASPIQFIMYITCRDYTLLKDWGMPASLSVNCLP